MRFDPQLQPGLRAAAQFRSLIEAIAASAGCETRQYRGLHARTERASFCDLDRGGERLRQIADYLLEREY
jgi:hypothetical protein